MTIRKLLYKIKSYRILKKVFYIIKIFIAIFLHLFERQSICKKQVWLFGVGDDIYANNVRVFYEYIIKHTSKIKAYWVCEKQNFNKMADIIPCSNIICRGSIDNYIKALDASAAIYGFSDYDVAPGLYRVLRSHKTIIVNLSHGFDGLKGMPSDYYKPLPADIICAASSYEQKMKITKCGADKNKVRLTGFARFDNLYKVESKNNSIRKILFMPTWRDWYEQEGLDFTATKMHNAYYSLFKKMEVLSKKYSLSVKYILHPRIASHLKNSAYGVFSNIDYSTNSQSIQELLIDCDLFITDYSSVFWDSLYIGKPTLLFWFDEVEYRRKRGLLVNRNFYNYVYTSESALLNIIEQLVLDSSKYVNISDNYFNWRDNRNCQRIYKEIINFQK